MSYLFKKAKFQILSLFPLFFLFYISLTGNSIIDFNLFSINILYIMVYFFTLRNPENLGYGFIFLAGIITDVVIGFPFGVNALSLLIIAGVAAYVRAVTVRITLLNDWISFIPALLLANFIYFLSLYFLSYEVDYFYLLKNSISTFIFYPVLWGVFTLILNLYR